MDINILIEQFFEGTLSLEEEKMLCNYLRNNEVPSSMQRDKEAVLALCGCSPDCSLPQGAAQRLEAILDELDSNISPAEVVSRPAAKSRMKIWKIPKVARAVVAAAAAVALIFLLYRGGGNESTGEWAMQEKDTFSTPEEARLCVRQALGELMLAMNTAHENTIAIGYTLEESARQARAVNININR